MATLDVPKKTEEGEQVCVVQTGKGGQHGPSKIQPVCVIHPTPVPIHAALFYRLKSKGFNECKEVGEAYAACCKDRTISIAWACRSEMAALNTCMAQQ